jgi:DNA-binding MarR family transcriptional regulator
MPAAKYRMRTLINVFTNWLPLVRKISLVANADANAIRRMFSTVSLGSPENAVGFILWRITARYQRETDRAFLPLNLTNLQFVTLALAAWFERTGEAVSQAELARFGGIQPMQLSLMLKVLEKKGFISRERNESDTRAKRVAVTQAGLKTLRKALPIAIDVQERLFGTDGHPDGNLHQTLLELDRASAARELD